jgi:hypothetical protein
MLADVRCSQAGSEGSTFQTEQYIAGERLNPLDGQNAHTVPRVYERRPGPIFQSLVLQAQEGQQNKLLTAGKQIGNIGKCAKKRKCYERRSHRKQCNKFEDSQLSCEMP